MAPITSLDMRTSFGSASSVTSCPLSRAPSSCEERWVSKITRGRGPARCLAHNPWTCVNFVRFPDFFFKVSSPESIGLTWVPWFRALHPGKESSGPFRERACWPAASPVHQEGACALEETALFVLLQRHQGSRGHLASLGKASAVTSPGP